MSFSQWTTKGYGVDQDILNKITEENIIEEFLELHKDEIGNFDKDDSTPCSTPDEFRQVIVGEDEDEADIFLCDYYSDKYGFSSESGIIIDLLNKWFDEHGFKSAGEYIVWEQNEDGEEGIMMCPLYPWEEKTEAKESYERLTEKDINDAFMWALSEVGVKAESPCDYISIESW